LCGDGGSGGNPSGGKKCRAKKKRIDELKTHGPTGKWVTRGEVKAEEGIMAALWRKKRREVKVSPWWKQFVWGGESGGMGT